MPVEATIMVAIPELDGATGRWCSAAVDGPGDARLRARDLRLPGARACSAIPSGRMLAARIEKLVALRRSAAAERKLAIVLFNFPPNAGNTGTAAYPVGVPNRCSTRSALKAGRLHVDVPGDVDALRDAMLTATPRSMARTPMCTP
jgi:magnesium chelatase subunit H